MVDFINVGFGCGFESHCGQDHFVFVIFFRSDSFLCFDCFVGVFIFWNIYVGIEGLTYLVIENNTTFSIITFH